MKLCQLLHESGRCPTCGGETDVTGTATTKRFPEPIFPNKEGVWDTDAGPKTREDLDNQQVDRAARTKIDRPTGRFDRVMPTPKQAPRKRFKR